MKPSDLGVVVGKEYHIDCARIKEFKEQPRGYFDKEKMEGLEVSIKKWGQTHAGKVKFLDAESCVLVDGARRFRVCKKLGIPFKATIVEGIPDRKAHFLHSVIANHGQEGLTDLENLKAIEQIQKDYPEYSLADVGAAFGEKAGWVREHLRLRNLPQKVLDLMDPELPDGKRLTLAKALALLPVTKPEAQIAIAENTVRGGLKTKEVKQLAQEHGSRQHAEGWSPRQEYERLEHLLRRVAVDSDLILKRPSKYFAEIFENRSPSDLADMLALATKGQENLLAIQQMLSRFKKETAKKAG